MYAIRSYYESLPFDSETFDRVVSQFGLMFFQDQIKAIKEMRRVVRTGGKICVAVWASLQDTPGYAAVVNILSDLFGPEVAKSIETVITSYSIHYTKLYDRHNDLMLRPL